jgi:hypothetical protein
MVGRGMRRDPAEGRSMTKIRTLIAALAFVVAPLAAMIVTAPPAMAQVATIEGDWQGVYFQGPTPTSFTAHIEVAGSTIVGTIVEPNTPAQQQQTAFLTSTFVGTLNAGQIAFTKQYDGSGGQTHSVRYAGAVQNGLRRITGEWRLPNGANGRFEMVR